MYHRALFRASVTGHPLQQPAVLATILSFLPLREALLCGRVCPAWHDLFLRCDVVFWKRAARAALIPPSFRGAFWLMMAYDATPELLQLQLDAMKHSVDAGTAKLCGAAARGWEGWEGWEEEEEEEEEVGK